MPPVQTSALHAHDGMLLAHGYVRVVHGARGDYIEIARDQLAWENFLIPPGQKWRVDDPTWSQHVYYVEYRSIGASNVKLYDQQKPVSYAGYKVGMLYISPNDVAEQVVESIRCT